MNSYNHYAYGAVVDWLYEVAAGIKIDEAKPAFEHVYVKPVIDKRLTQLSASIDTIYGKVSSKWEIKQDKVLYEIEIPKTATIIIDGQIHKVDKGVCKFEI